MWVPLSCPLEEVQLEVVNLLPIALAVPCQSWIDMIKIRNQFSAPKFVSPTNLKLQLCMGSRCLCVYLSVCTRVGMYRYDVCMYACSYICMFLVSRTQWLFWLLCKRLWFSLQIVSCESGPSGKIELYIERDVYKKVVVRRFGSSDCADSSRS